MKNVYDSLSLFCFLISRLKIKECSLFLYMRPIITYLINNLFTTADDGKGEG